MLIEIHRYRIRGTYCDSTMHIDGQHVCDCAENAYYRIPTGLYDVQLLYNQEAKRKVPTLFAIDESNPSLPIKGEPEGVFKIGNGVHTNLKGQIIVGKFRVSGVVIHSRETFIQLYDRINNSMRRGNKVQIQITES